MSKQIHYKEGGEMMGDFWMSILYLVIGIVIGAVIGWYVTRHLFQKQMKENPPINEKMIRALYAQMGRKPSEKQIKQIMKSVNDAK